LQKYPDGKFIKDVQNRKNSIYADIENSKYNKALRGNISDCNEYLDAYPSGNYVVEVNDRISYLNARNTNTTAAYTTYISNNPNGYNVQNAKNEIQIIRDREERERQRIAAEKQKIAALKEQERLRQEREIKLKQNSNKINWKLGNKLCKNVSGGIACGTINAWNEDKSMVQIKIVTSPGGTLEGESLTKNNLIWVASSGTGWHICFDDEIQTSLANDKSKEEPKVIIEKSSSNSSNNSNNAVAKYSKKCGGRGVCLQCNGRGGKPCDYHDTNGDGHCTTCNDTGWRECSYCYGKGTCRQCGGTGK